MDNSLQHKREARIKRAWRVRNRIHGTAQRPRLCINKTNAHIHVQLIDDGSGRTLLAGSTFAKQFRQEGLGRRNKKTAAALGRWIGEKAKEIGIGSVILDRGHSKYHGVIAEFANAAREIGLEF